MSAGKISDNRTGPRDGALEAQYRVVGNVPYELIAVEAYHKWQGRCRLLGRIIHGGDRADWLDAEADVTEKWNDLTPDDLAEFQQQISIRRLVPPPERVAVRAYFKSIAASDQSSDQIKRNWIAAESEEKMILFAEAFYRFLSQRRQSLHRAGQLVSRN
jgi:hypothetical protein